MQRLYGGVATLQTKVNMRLRHSGIVRGRGNSTARSDLNRILGAMTVRCRAATREERLWRNPSTTDTACCDPPHIWVWAHSRGRLACRDLICAETYPKGWCRRQRTSGIHEPLVVQSEPRNRCSQETLQSLKFRLPVFGVPIPMVSDIHSPHKLRFNCGRYGR